MQINPDTYSRNGRPSPVHIPCNHDVRESRFSDLEYSMEQLSKVVSNNEQSVKYLTTALEDMNYGLTTDQVSANATGLKNLKKDLHDVNHAVETLASAAFDRSQDVVLRLPILEGDVAKLSQRFEDLQVRSCRASHGLHASTKNAI